MSDSLGIDDDVMGLAMLTIGNDIIDNILFVVIVLFGKQDILGTVGNTAPQSDVSGISAHYLDDTASLVRGRGILNLIDSLHCSVHCGIEADGVLGTGDIQVNGSGKTDGINAQSGQCLRTTIGTVTADDNDTVNTMLFADLSTLLLSFRLLELQATCGSKNGTTALDDIGYILGFHIYDLFIQKTLITFFNTLNLQSSCNSCTNNCTDSSVHSRCITAAGQYADRLNLFCHDCYLLSKRTNNFLFSTSYFNLFWYGFQ